MLTEMTLKIVGSSTIKSKITRHLFNRGMIIMSEIIPYAASNKIVKSSESNRNGNFKTTAALMPAEKETFSVRKIKQKNFADAIDIGSRYRNPVKTTNAKWHFDSSPALASYRNR